MMKKFLILGMISFLSTSAFAISESNYATEYQQKVIPVINNYQSGFFQGKNQIAIRYATYASNPIAARCMVVLPGRSEPVEKYAEVVSDLDSGALKGEFIYLLMDHRGQGSSGRMTTPQDMGHVDEFENYRLDLKKFMDTIVAQKNCSETYLLAHSLGAGIAIDFLQHYPNSFDRVAFSSPMLKIITAPYKYAVARSIVLASMAAGRGKKFAVGQKPFNPMRNFEANTFTSSRVRYDMAMDMFDRYPITRLGGVSNRWLNEVMKGTKQMRKDYSGIHVPMRVFAAGIESYSWPSEMIRLCDEAKNCVRTFLPTSKHEVLMDRDVNRDVVLGELETFFR